jgi:hypothetical protein
MRVPHGALDRSIVVSALCGFVIEADIDPNEPSPVTTCDDLANFASHREFPPGSQKDTHIPHTT